MDRLEIIEGHMAAGMTPVEAIAKAKAEHPELFIETKKADWDNSPALRAEFGNNRARYAAYCDAVKSGKVRIIGGLQK